MELGPGLGWELNVSIGTGDVARRRRAINVALAALALLSAGAAARILLGSEIQPQLPPRTADEPGGAAAQPPAYVGFVQYQTLAQLVVNSDVIVVGTVDEVLPGPVIPDEGGDPRFDTRYVNTTLTVDETWKGTVSDTVTVTTNELAYGNPGGGSEWREPGVRVIAFLVPTDSDTADPSLIVTADEAGIYIVRGDIVVPTVSGTTSIGEEISGFSMEELRERVQATVEAA